VEAAVYQHFAGKSMLFEVELQSALENFSALFCTCLNSAHLAATFVVSHFYSVLW
jgi:hypothetical protein